MRLTHRWPQEKSVFVGAVVLLCQLTGASQLWARQSGQLPPLPDLRQGQTLTLRQAVEQANRANRSLEVVRVDLELAAARRRATYAAIFPSLYGKAEYSAAASHAEQPAQPRVSSNTYQRHTSVGLQARLPIVQSQRWSNLSVARAQQELAQLDVEQTRQFLLYQVAETYFQAALLQRLIRVYRAQAEARKRHGEAALARYQSGVGDLVDVKRAHTDLVAVHEEQLKALVALENTRDALAVLIDCDCVPQPVESAQVRSPDLASGENHQLPLQRRWDLRLTQKSVEVAQNQLTHTWLQFVPTLDATLQYSYDFPPLEVSSNQAIHQWFAGVALSVPLFDYSMYPQLQTQDLSLKRSQLKLKQQRLQAQQDITRAQRSVTKAEQLIQTAQLKARLADDALELSQVDYINGLGSALTVVDAQRTSQTAHVDLETRRFELELARLDLFHSSGTDIFETLE